jgi:hypothetical protein
VPQNQGSATIHLGIVHGHSYTAAEHAVLTARNPWSPLGPGQEWQIFLFGIRRTCRWGKVLESQSRMNLAVGRGRWPTLRRRHLK